MDVVSKKGWGIIVNKPNGYVIDNLKIYDEIKNKHNTMNSTVFNDTLIKILEQLHKDNYCACMLVEIIALHSQNIIWKRKFEKKMAKKKKILIVKLDV